MAKQPHHRTARYQRWSAHIRLLANASPYTVCWRDGQTMAWHHARYPDRTLTWHAGHTLDGSNTWQPWPHITQCPPPGDWLAPEVSTCNIIARNDKRGADRHTETW